MQHQHILTVWQDNAYDKPLSSPESSSHSETQRLENPLPIPINYNTIVETSNKN